MTREDEISDLVDEYIEWLDTLDDEEIHKQFMVRFPE